jgi:DNA-binding MarR family transcriptional regulator
MLVALRHVTQAMDLYSRRLAAQQGLTVPQLTVLRALHRLPGKNVSISDLSRSVHLRPATVTEMLVRMERRDLVSRARSTTDRRCVLVSLTEPGKTVLAKAPPPLPEPLLASLEHLAPWEQLMLLSALQRLASLMEPVPDAPTAMHSEAHAATDYQKDSQSRRRRVVSPPTGGDRAGTGARDAD